MIQIGNESVPLTDAGNAQLFAHEHGADLRWVPEWGTWIRYDGARWARIASEGIIPLAIKTARAFYKRAADEPDEDHRKALVAHAKAMESATRLEAMIRLARGFLATPADRFDREAYTLNVKNGTLRLRASDSNVGLWTHEREDMLTKIAPVVYDATATCPQWDAFLARVLPDPGTRTWVQRFIGYCLTGDVGEQVLAFFFGRGANGKSTLIDVLLAILGDYAKAGAPDLLLAKLGEVHPTEQADLQGARLVACQETEAGRQWAERTVKALTGGDKIKARLMRCDFFEFSPTHKLIVSANHKPKVRGQDEGIWRRIMLVPFEIQIPKAERDKNLPATLKSEASGILMWAVRGCLDWQRDGLGEPSAIAAATAAYRADQDHLAHFVDDCCELAPDAFESTSTLYVAYQAWCTKSGDRPWARETFREGLLERGFVDGRTRAARGIRGVRVRAGAQWGP